MIEIISDDSDRGQHNHRVRYRHQTSDVEAGVANDDNESSCSTSTQAKVSESGLEKPQGADEFEQNDEQHEEGQQHAVAWLWGRFKALLFIASDNERPPNVEEPSSVEHQASNVEDVEQPPTAADEQQQIVDQHEPGVSADDQQVAGENSGCCLTELWARFKARCKTLGWKKIVIVVCLLLCSGLLAIPIQLKGWKEGGLYMIPALFAAICGFNLLLIKSVTDDAQPAA